MSPVGAVFVPFPPKTGTNILHPRPPSIVELVSNLEFSSPKMATMPFLAAIITGNRLRPNPGTTTVSTGTRISLP